MSAIITDEDYEQTLTDAERQRRETINQLIAEKNGETDEKMKLGEGNQGTVYKLHCPNVVVVKEFRRNGQVDKAARRDIGCLRQLSKPEYRHCNIVCFLDAYIGRQQRPVMVFEYAPEGSLEMLLHRRTVLSYSVGLALSWCGQFCAGVAFLHSLKLLDPSNQLASGHSSSPTPRAVLHRDLKPANILLFDNYQRAKISDFGSACLDFTLKSRGAGTGDYMAPEVLLTGRYSTECDVYSAGVTIHEVLNRRITRRSERCRALRQGPQTALDYTYSFCVLNSPHLRPSMRLLSRFFDTLLNSCPPSCKDHEVIVRHDHPTSPIGAKQFTKLFDQTDVLQLWVDAVLDDELHS